MDVRYCIYLIDVRVGYATSYDLLVDLTAKDRI